MTEPATEVRECDECGGVYRTQPDSDVDLCVPCRLNRGDGE